MREKPTASCGVRRMPGGAGCASGGATHEIRRSAMTTLRKPEQPLATTQAKAVIATLGEGRASVADTARAFGVVVGPSLVLDAVMAAGVASAVRAVRRHRHPRRAAIAASALVAAYATVGRPLMLHWGATCEELHTRLPGDDLVPGRAIQSTRAITVEAPVAAVWPWLAQLGQDRAGFYSYEALENLAGCEIHNADEIHPEWQERARGETVPLHRLYGLPVES